MSHSFVALEGQVVTSHRGSRTLAFMWPSEDFVRQIPLKGKTHRALKEGDILIAEMQRRGPDDFNLLALVDEEMVAPPPTLHFNLSNKLPFNATILTTPADSPFDILNTAINVGD